MWRDLGKVTASYLDSKTLQDIVDQMRERGTMDTTGEKPGAAS